MVKILGGDSVRAAVWFDGYRPEADTLQARYNAALRKYELPLLGRDVICSEKDLQLSDLVEILFARLHTLRSQHHDALVGAFHVRPRAVTPADELTTLVAEDLEGERHNTRYGALIFTYSEEEWPSALQAAEETVAVVGFQVKPASRYQNLTAFERVVDKVLQHVMSPYVAPSLAAEASLYRLGLTTSHHLGENLRE